MKKYLFLIPLLLLATSVLAVVIDTPKIDHIQEETSSHGVVIDNNATVSGTLGAGAATVTSLDAGSGLIITLGGISANRIDGVEIQGSTSISAGIPMSGNEIDISANRIANIGSDFTIENGFATGDMFLKVVAGRSIFTEGNFTINNDNEVGKGLILEGSAATTTSRGGLVKWFRQAAGTSPNATYTFVNLAGKFVFSEATQDAYNDEGNAYVDMVTGAISFAGGDFDIDSSGNITDVSNITSDGAGTNSFADFTAIGTTTSPTVALDVAGDAIFTGTVKASNYFSSDGSGGITQTETGVTNFDITIKDGLVVSFTKN